MLTTAKIVALCFCLGTCASGAVGQKKPSLPLTIAAPTDDFSKPPELPRYQPRVEFTGGNLKISADNSSLNQILAEVSSKLAMKITGAIPEERVFGTYGPAAPAIVLAHLLAGSGSNMLLREDARRMPIELILTRRSSGPSPPSPGSRSSQQYDTQDLPPQLMPHVSNRPRQSLVPTEVQPNGLPPSAPTNRPMPPGITTQQSPNGVRTPQQIYDQLIQLQQKNAPTAPN